MATGFSDGFSSGFGVSPAATEDQDPYWIASGQQQPVIVLSPPTALLTEIAFVDEVAADPDPDPTPSVAAPSDGAYSELAYSEAQIVLAESEFAALLITGEHQPIIEPVEIIEY